MNHSKDKIKLHRLLDKKIVITAELKLLSNKFQEKELRLVEIDEQIRGFLSPLKPSVLSKNHTDRTISQIIISILSMHNRPMSLGEIYQEVIKVKKNTNYFSISTLLYNNLSGRLTSIPNLSRQGKFHSYRYFLNNSTRKKNLINTKTKKQSKSSVSIKEKRAV